MTLRFRTRRKATGHSNSSLWPVMLLLLLIVLVPTACVLWMMNEALVNERLAVRQKLTDSYRIQLSVAQDRLDKYWERVRDTIESADADTSPSSAFHHCVSEDLADAIVYFTADGVPVYPIVSVSSQATSIDLDVQWLTARRLEYEEDDPRSAANVYATIAKAPGTSDSLSALALKAQARCLLKSEEVDQALKLLVEDLGQPQYEGAKDSQGRLIVADAELLAIQSMNAPDNPMVRLAAQRLTKRLSDYQDATIPSAQRRFLMKQLRSQLPESSEFPTLDAEELAARYLESTPRVPNTTRLQRSGLDDVWQMASSDGRAVALFRESRISASSEQVLDELNLPSGVTVAIARDGAEEPDSDAIFTTTAGKHLPQWQLSLQLSEDALPGSGKGKVATYFWIALLVITSTAILALLVARTIGRRWKDAALKNDLVATVSHELKTPLASIRLLVDTLIDSHELNETQREYLELIAKENTRLSHLIDNFLTFSRMEHDRQRFEFDEVCPAQVVDRAVEVMSDRLNSHDCRFECRVDPDLPKLFADRDALVTVLANLIENAYRYSGDEKEIQLKAYSSGSDIRFEVSDNGVGLSPKDKRKVFQRFYQADRTLTGHRQGCGLGLSIVQHIVGAHGGRKSKSSAASKAEANSPLYCQLMKQSVQLSRQRLHAKRHRANRRG